MDLKIDFNNPNILRGYVDQALPQVELETAKVTVGKEGGLAYLLFDGSDWHNVPRELRMSSLDEMKSVRAYFDAVESYLNAARGHAQRFDFGLVSVSDGKISPVVGTDLYVFTAGIGDVSVGSVEKFERFLQMVKECRGNLEQQYSNVRETIGALKDSKR